MHISKVALLVAAFVLADAASIPVSHVVHEKRDLTPRKFQKRDRLASGAILPVRIGLAQSNLHKGYDHLMDVSTPGSANYGKHWTSEEVIDMFKPSEETVSAVHDWLVASGISSERITHSENKGWLAFDASTAEVEDLLHTEYHEYEVKGTGDKTAACDEYLVPKHIKRHIDYITPGVKLLAPISKRSVGKKALKRQVSSHVEKRTFGISSPSKYPISPNSRPYLNGAGPSNASSLATCDVAISPACVAALYSIPAATLADPSNPMGVFEEGDFYAQQDLDLFFANFTPSIPKGTHPTAQFIDGAEAPVALADAGGESDLDFQLAFPILWPQTTVLYQTDDSNYATGVETTSGFFNTFLDALDGSYCTYSAFNETGNDALDPVYPDNGAAGGYQGQLMCGVYKPTNVISVSYGGQEADLPAYYQQRQCNEFMKLGLQGHSIFFASGDDGVAGPGGDDNDNGCLGPDSTVFSPAWPNNCPFVTNVGATKVLPNMTVYQPESVANDLAGHPYRSAYSSGGGFSNLYSAPDYQLDAVTTYLNNYVPSYASYSISGNGNGTSNVTGILPFPGEINGTSSGTAPVGLYNRAGRGYPDVSANGDNIAVYNMGKAHLSGGTSAATPIFASIVNRINEERIAANKSPVGFINPALYANPQILNDITSGTNPGCGTNGFPASKGWDPSSGLGTPNYPKMLEFFMSLP